MDSERALIEEDLDAEIGRRVHQLMWDQRLTQTAFGRRVGMDQSSVAKRLRGKVGWTPAALKATAAVLNVSVAYLFGEEEGSRPTPPNVPEKDYKPAGSLIRVDFGERRSITEAAGA